MRCVINIAENASHCFHQDTTAPDLACRALTKNHVGRKEINRPGKELPNGSRKNGGRIRLGYPASR